MSKRKEVTDYILNNVKISKTTYNIIKTVFENMSDDEFHNFMLNLKNKKVNLSFIIPHEENITEEDIFAWVDTIGIQPFQQLVFTDENGDDYLSPVATLIIDAPCKRAAQTQDKKVSIPTGNKINVLTGQVTSESLSAKITLPETLIHIGFGAKKPLYELLNARGGDLGLMNAMDKELFEKGKVSMEDIMPYSTKTVSTKTLKAYFLASHLKSTL
jgi:hypothetical protein